MFKILFLDLVPNFIYINFIFKSKDQFFFQVKKPIESIYMQRYGHKVYKLLIEYFYPLFNLKLYQKG